MRARGSLALAILASLASGLAAGAPPQLDRSRVSVRLEGDRALLSASYELIRGGDAAVPWRLIQFRPARLESLTASIADASDGAEGITLEVLRRDAGVAASGDIVLPAAGSATPAPLTLSLRWQLAGAVRRRGESVELVVPLPILGTPAPAPPADAFVAELSLDRPLTLSTAVPRGWQAAGAGAWRLRLPATPGLLRITLDEHPSPWTRDRLVDGVALLSAVVLIGLGVVHLRREARRQVPAP